MEKQLTFILGGARSGKSSYAEQLATQTGKPVLFVATAEAGDEEMAARIERHRAQRPADWATLEAQSNVGPAIAQAAPQGVVLLDCITLLVANAMLPYMHDDELIMPQAEDAIRAEIEQLLEVHKRGSVAWIVISNEVGQGVVPPYSSGRAYRDLLGRANQMIAAQADEVLLMVAGLPWSLKPHRPSSNP